MLDGPRDSSNDYRPENSPPSNTFNIAAKSIGIATIVRCHIAKCNETVGMPAQAENIQHKI